MNGIAACESISAPTAVRRRILVILVCLSLFSYLLRMNISVAQQFMVPELGLSDIQVGQVFSSFMAGYALFQVPAGVWGDQRGPRFVLTVAVLSWGFLTLLTGLIPGLLVRGAAAAFLSLLILRFMLGVGEAAMYPVAARVVANWMPPAEHAFSNAVVIAGSTVGSALTPPLIAYLMQAFGWRFSFYLTGLFPFGIALLWWWQARDHPEQHQAVNHEEIALIAAGRAVKSATGPVPSWWSLGKNRNIAFLCLSYFLTSYVMFVFVFWLYKYFVDVRKFTVVGGGWALSLPFVVATVALPSMGYLSDRLSARRGALWGRRRVAMGCLVFCGLLLLVGAAASGPWMAVAAISLSVACLFSTEGPYWSTVIKLAGPHAGAAGGLMNMVGNFGGAVSTAVVPFLVHIFGWFGALACASVFAIIAAALWLLIRSDSKIPVQTLGGLEQAAGEAK
ncbi:MAG: MFS transporter [Acidobacteria bacterium]|nr:MFS transporter [Acidobacteriota bacterium]